MKKGVLFYLSAIAILVLLLWAYSNHFNNPFNFDDDHTIVTNNAIRSIRNIPSFFKDARTTSSLPANQAYRPGVTTLNAIDFWIGGKAQPDPFYFHVSIFMSYILLGVLLFLFFLKIFNQTIDHKWNSYFALFAAGFFCLHTANAETINYIIARSDSFSTLMIILAMVIYMYKPNWRSKFIYLVPVVIGLFVKEPVVMFAPLLFLYVILFEDGVSLTEIFKGQYRKLFLKAFVIILPTLIIGMVYFIFSKRMTPPTWTSGAHDRVHYLFTQPFVIVHYINNFFLPLNLSADTDWTLIKSIVDDRVLIGLGVVVGMIISAFVLSKNKLMRPVTFGLLWFLLALLPTSSIFPLAEVLNDHRTFFPYVGLVMALVWTFAVLVLRFENGILQSKSGTAIVFSLVFIFLFSHAYGTHQRNKIWNNGESLWYDVTIKSPANGRGLMNYANSQMAKANYKVAEDYYNRALKIWPNYSYLYINIAVLKSATGFPVEAEANFKKALSLDPGNPEAYYYYGNWLKSTGKLVEAKELVNRGLQISPEHINNKRLIDEITLLEQATTANDFSLEKMAKEKPTPENYLNLSLLFYRQEKYEKCVEASREALKLKPDYSAAFNNICSAEIMLGNMDEAIVAGQEALKLNPDFELAKNNLKDALERKRKENDQLILTKQKPSADSYIQLSLIYYTNHNYLKCVEAATEALKLNPQSDIAYNNICSAYNMLKMWDKAIDAGEKGLSLKADNQLLKNNLVISHNGKKNNSNK